MRLSLQVKRWLTISDAETNSDFREVIQRSWQTLQKPDYRAARLLDGRLEGCLFVAPSHLLPEREWLAGLFDAAGVNDDERVSLMAASPAAGRPATGRIVCSCFSVGYQTLLDTIQAHKISDVAEIGRLLKACTNCGSCLPELPVVCWADLLNNAQPMRRTRVKICGITRVEDAQAAASAGADAIGLVFYPPSPRFVSIEQAREIALSLPPFVTVTALFVNAAREEIGEVLAQVPVELLQFHGNECPDYCAGFERPYIKAIRVREGMDLLAERQRYQQARGLLLDTYRPGVPGGTGESFDWSLIPAELAGQVVLAGGLEANNIERAIAAVHPYGVDVSGGVERVPGLKDPAKIERFMRGVCKADEWTNE